MSFKPTYPTLWLRLMANTYEPDNEQSCWVWSGKMRCRYGYGRFNLRIPMRGGKVTQITAHIASWICMEVGSIKDNDDFWIWYLEFRHSGLELDHTCENPSCIRPDHLEPVTSTENKARGADRRRRRALQHTSHLQF